MSPASNEKPSRLSVRLETSSNLTQDPQSGISEHVYIVICNDEDKPITLNFPGLYQHPVTKYYTERKFYFLEAIRKGIFQFKCAIHQDTVQLDTLGLDKVGRSQPSQLVIAPRNYAKYIVLRRGSSSLNNVGLQTDKDYLLGFAHASMPIHCSFATPAEEESFKAKTLIPETTSSLNCNEIVSPIFIQCTGDPIRIRVLEGIRIPRFQIAFQFSSFTCDLSGTIPFSLTICVKSLEPKPVTVSLNFPPWYGFDGFTDVFQLTDVATSEAVDLPGNLCSLVGEENPSLSCFVEFHEGTEHVRKWTFDQEQPSDGEPGELHCLESGKIYEAELNEFAFTWWKYGTKKEVLGDETFDMDDWSQNGAIQPKMVETEQSFAKTMKNILEREKKSSLFKLPLELRDQIYDYLESTHPGKLRFRTVKRV